MNVGKAVEAGTKRKGSSSFPAMAEESKENRRSGNMGGTKRPKLYPDNPAVTALNEQIERECKIRDGAAKLQEAAKTPWQAMEASKGLFVSNAKILALMKELQQVQSQKEHVVTAKKSDSEEEILPCMAKIAISELRIPLEWKQFEQAKGKCDPTHKMGVFCLFRLGNQVMDTHAIVEVDRSTMDISFTDIVIFPDHVDKDFVLEVEVYCSSPSTTETVSSSTPTTPLTPLKMLRKIKKDWASDSPLSHSSSYQSLSAYVPPLPAVNPSHHFTLAGHAHFTLKDVACSCRTYTLIRGAVGSSGTASTSSASDHPLLPLWGQICCSIMAQPNCATSPRITGFINVQQKVTGLPAWIRLWCVMRQNHMRCWAYPEDVGMKMPTQTIDLTPTTQVENAPRLTMRRPNTLVLKDGNKELFISFESKEEREEWTAAIQQAIVDQKVWGDSCSYIISKPASKFYARDNDVSPLPSFSGNVGFNRGLQSETVI